MQTSEPKHASENATAGADARKRLLALRVAQQRDVRKVAAIVAEPARAVAPATPAQQSLWFLDRLHGASALYNSTIAVHLEGMLDVGSLSTALRELAQRHASLRTGFEMVGDVLQQRVIPLAEIAAAFALDVVEVDSRPVRDDTLAIDPDIEQRLVSFAELPFDLSTAPLMRARLLRFAPNRHLLQIVVHHAVTDGWSMSVLADDIGVLYDHARGQSAVPAHAAQERVLPPLAIRYVDFAAWLTTPQRATAVAADITYWRTRLHGVTPLPFPTDRPRPPHALIRGTVHRFALEEGATANARAFARSHGATLFIVLLAAFKAVVARYTNQGDVTVGTPVAGRERPELEGMIGYFVNSVALRTECDLDGDFDALVKTVRETVIEALAHQAAPFDAVVGALNLPRDASRNPLYQVSFALNNQPSPEFRMDGLQTRLQAVATGTTKFDLSLTFVERDGRLDGTIEYSTDLFDAETIERLAGHYRMLLVAALAEPACAVARLPLMDSGERHRVLTACNATDAAFPRDVCVTRLIEERVERSPEAVAVIFRDQELSFGEVNRRANRLAHRLRRLGVSPDDRVGVCLQRGLELPVALLAVFKAGGAYVPIDPAAPPERRRFMVEDACIDVVITADMDGSALGDRVHVQNPADASLAGESSDNPEPVAGPQHLAYVIYTSGTTGRPKGVLIEHSGLVNNIHWQIREFGFDARDRYLQWTTFTFDASLWEIWTPMVVGAPQVIADEHTMRDPALTLGLIRDQRVTVATTVPGFLAAMLTELEGRAPQMRALPLRMMLVGGESLDVVVARRWAALYDIELINSYGPTETTIDATFLRDVRRVVADRSMAAIPIGRPIANTRVYIVDARLQPVPQGVVGELYIASAGIARGYLNRPELTAERFVPDPFAAEPGARLYRTGDLGRWRADGSIEFLGRADRQVKLRGYRIELEEIESGLRGCEGVQHAAVVLDKAVLGEPNHPDRLVGYVVPSSLDTAKLRQILGQRLPAYMVPAIIVGLDALPTFANGKLDRNALPRPTAADSRADVIGAGDEPATALERHIAQIWQEVLGGPRVGRHDDFFDLGGHSLLAAQVASRIRASLGVDFALRLMFDAPTVAALAARPELAGASEAGVPTQAQAPMVRAEGDGPVPATAAQQSLWYLDSLLGASGLYNIPLALVIKGPLDVDALAASVQALVDRHDSLRMRLQAIDGAPMLVVEPQLPLPLVRLDVGVDAAVGAGDDSIIDVDCRDRSGATLTHRQAVLAHEANRPFDLERAPLIRAGLFRSDVHEHVLLLVLHHSIADGWSLQILTHELSALYTARIAARISQGGLAAPLPELRLGFRDYAVWLQAPEQRARSDRQATWWRDRLAGLEPLQLPTDRPRPARPSQRGASLDVWLSAATSAAVREMAQAHQATPFMVLLAGFHALLSRYSAQADFAVGTVVAGRDRPETETMIGDFVNSLVMRAEVHGSPSFQTLLERTRQSVLDAFTHQEVSFDRLVAELDIGREVGRNPLFDVFFSLQTQPALASSLGPLAVEPLTIPLATAKFDLTLSLVQGSDGTPISGSIQYATDLFDAGTIDRLWRHYCTLLSHALDAPGTRVDSLELLGTTERMQLLQTWNDTVADYRAERSIHGGIAETARRCRDAIAIEQGEQRFTHCELDLASNRLAHALRARGAGRGMLVGLCVERSPRMVIAQLAVLKSGAAYVPLDPSYPAERLAYMAEDARIGLLVTEDALRGRVACPGVPMLVIDAEAGFVSAQPDEALADRTEPDDPAYVIYTSGSTGRPKGVVVPHRGVVNFLASMARQPGLHLGESLLAVTTLSFDIAVLELLLPLTVGARIVLATKEQAADAHALVALIEQGGITVMQATPATWRLLLDAGWRGAPRLRALIGGEALSLELAGRLTAKTCELWNLYGPTETTVWSSCWRVPADARSISIGRPIANTTIRVLDEHGALCPIGVPGEIHIGGDGVTIGYLHRPELTAERFIPDTFATRSCGTQARLYKTGDRGRWRADGTLEHLGRLDFQVKVRGHRIELGEIEAALIADTAISQCVVIVREDQPGDQRLVAYIVPADTQKSDADLATRLRATAAQQLPTYMLPQHVETLAQIPLLPNGKIDRKSLPRPQTGTPAATLEPGASAPRSPAEARLAIIWAEALGVASVDPTISFFDLGGHSLLALRMMHRIAEEFGQQLRLATLFDAPSVRAMAGLIDGGKQSADARCTVAIRASGSRPPLFFVSGWGGAILVFNELAKTLHPEQPLYVLDTGAFDVRSEPVLSVQQVAEQMVRDLRQVQPDGPYHLCGFSQGGKFLHEVAQQLTANGHEVGLLALLDCNAPGYPRRRDSLAWAIARLNQIRRQSLAKNIAYVATRVAYVRDRVTGRDRQLFKNDGEIGEIALAQSMQATADAMTAAWIAYTPRHYAGRMLLIRATIRPFYASQIDDDPHNGWGPLTGGGIDLRELKCLHEDMVKPENAPALAAILSEFLTKDASAPRLVGEQEPARPS